MFFISRIYYLTILRKQSKTGVRGFLFLFILLSLSLSHIFGRQLLCLLVIRDNDNAATFWGSVKLENEKFEALGVKTEMPQPRTASSKNLLAF